MSVGSILLAFLPDSLQEQISARKYFYKSARLIKDGPSRHFLLFSANPTS